MATYKEIIGIEVQSLSSDPPSPFQGQIWYNNSSNTLKYYANLSASWSTGGSLSENRSRMGSAGTQTAALGFGSLPPSWIGNNPPVKL